MGRVAVIGAGIQGVCVALELARRGCRVDLFDRESDILSRASLWNEGKIHLGYLYANDHTLRTARMMMQGSLQFARLIERWTSLSPSRLNVSSPFRYLVPVESLLEPAAIERHFKAVTDLIREAFEASGCSYLGQELPAEPFARLDDRKQDVDSSRTAAIYRTSEVSVDPAQIRAALKRALDACSRIRPFLRTRVCSVARADNGRLQICAERGAGEVAGYDSVVNTSWEDRLRIDATIGLNEDRPWLHRYKIAIHVNGYDGPPLGSTTMLLGPFGDLVEFATGHLYLSWYPCCRIGSWTDLCPPDMPPILAEHERAEVVAATLKGLGQYLPSARSLDLSRCEVTVAGGHIFSWGNTEITDPVSELHNRFDIGVHRRDNYFSIDTGKYCKAPLFAEQVGAMIAP